MKSKVDFVHKNSLLSEYEKVVSKKSIHVIGLFLIGMMAFSTHLKDEFIIFLNKEIPTTVSAHFDEDGILDFYRADVFTPVCEDTLCYPVELVMYWDEIGHFSHYDTIPGKGLTKMDHEPFTHDDYRKLNRLFRNRYPSFFGLKKEELTSSDTVDGYSGATISSVKDDAIDGAIYSCYTLWHIANGSISDSIENITPHYFNKDLISKLANKKDERVTRYLIKHFTEEDFSLYLTEVCEMMNNGGAYFAKNIIEKIPDHLFENPELQHEFCTNYHWLHEYAQLSVLKKLVGKQVSGELLEVLVENMDKGKSEKNELTQTILLENQH